MKSNNDQYVKRVKFGVSSFFLIFLCGCMLLNDNKTESTNAIDIGTHDSLTILSPAAENTNIENEKDDNFKLTNTPQISHEISETNESLKISQDGNSIVYADINGDNHDEEVEIFYIKEDFVTIDNTVMAIEYPYIKITVDSIEHVESLGQFPIHEAKILPFNSGIDNKDYIAVVLDIGGTGQGVALLYVITFNNGIQFLKVPTMDGEFSRDKYNYGFYAEYKYLDNYMIEIICLETGFTGEIPLDKSRYELTNIYDEDGKTTVSNYNPLGVDSICNVEIVTDNEKEYVEIAQYIWGIAHSGKIGFLITTLLWENESYIVVNQRVIP